MAAEGQHHSLNVQDHVAAAISACSGLNHMRHGLCRAATVWPQQSARAGQQSCRWTCRTCPIERSPGLCAVCSRVLIQLASLQVKRGNPHSLAPPAAASAVCSAISPPEDGRYPVMRMSGPEGCHCTSTSCRACVISTLPNSPTGEGARTPPTCSKSGAAKMQLLDSLETRSHK